VSPRRRSSRRPAKRGRGDGAARARVPAALARARIHPAVRHVLEVLDRAGHRSWLVGGAVRDLLLHRGRRAAADLDVATPATPAEVTALFPRVVPTGVEHGTVTVLVGEDQVEVTTFRGEGAYRDGRRPSSVTFHTDLDQDLSRRDFTMNALAWDPIGRVFRDPFGGREDMRRHLIRAVGDAAERFAEDGLRPLRAIRFAAQLGYRLDRRTLAAIRPAAPVVRLVSAERVADELGKLLAAPRPGPALGLLQSTGLLPVVLPPLAGLSAATLAHLRAVAVAVPPDPVLRFAALLHVVPPVEALQALVGLRLPNRLGSEVAALLRERGCLRERGEYRLPETPPQVRRWLSRVGAARAPALLTLWDADARHLGARSRKERAALRRLRSRAGRVLAHRPPLDTGDLALDGRAVMEQLGIGPGRAVGLALRHLLDRVLEHPERNRRDALAAELAEWWRGRQPGTEGQDPR
jgi:tRNA nucleotidyltransferase (CCA-adding enzyme)